MSSTIYLQNLQVDNAAALDPTAKFQRVYIDPASQITAISSPGVPPTPVNDSQGSTGAYTATLAASAGVTTAIMGFDLSVAAVLALSALTVTVTGLSGFPSNTISFALSLLTTGSTLLWRPPSPLPASAANTAIVVHIPATGVSSFVNVYGQQA
jgi:hypothetical protein